MRQTHFVNLQLTVLSHSFTEHCLMKSEMLLPTDTDRCHKKEAVDGQVIWTWQL